MTDFTPELASPDKHISSKDMECLKEAFTLFDRDRDGEINTDELGKVRSFMLKEIQMYLCVMVCAVCVCACMHVFVWDGWIQCLVTYWPLELLYPRMEIKKIICVLKFFK